MADDKTPTITSRTRLYKRSATAAILGTAIVLAAISLTTYIGYPNLFARYNHLPQFFAWTFCVVLLIHWAIGKVTFVAYKVEVFDKFVRFSVHGAVVDVRFCEITSITQREGFLRDAVFIQTGNESFSLDNMSNGFAVVDAISDNAMQSEDENDRRARFLLKREFGQSVLNDAVGGGREQVDKPVFTAENTFLRYILSAPGSIFTPALIFAVVVGWLISGTLVRNMPFSNTVDAVAIYFCLFVLSILTAAYAFFNDQQLLVFKDRVVIESATTQRVVHKDDLDRISIKRFFITQFIRLRLKDGRKIDLRGFDNPRTVKSTIEWSDAITTRQQRNDAVEAILDGKRAGQQSNEVGPAGQPAKSVISLKKQTDSDE